MFDTVGLEFVGVGSAENLITGKFGSDDLHDDIAIRETDDETILGRIVLVLGLGDETLAGVVVGLSLTTTLVLGLVPTVRDQHGAQRIGGVHLTCSTQSS